MDKNTPKGLNFLFPQAPVADFITFDLPVAPSTNDLHSRTKQQDVLRSQHYRDWIKAAQWEVLVQRTKMGVKRLGPGLFTSYLRIAEADPADVDNRGKATRDLLHRCHVTPDDRFLYCHFETRDPAVPPGRCWITVWTLPEGYGAA